MLSLLLEMMLFSVNDAVAVVATVIAAVVVNVATSIVVDTSSDDDLPLVLMLWFVVVVVVAVSELDIQFLIVCNYKCSPSNQKRKQTFDSSAHKL